MAWLDMHLRTTRVSRPSFSKSWYCSTALTFSGKSCLKVTTTLYHFDSTRQTRQRRSTVGLCIKTPCGPSRVSPSKGSNVGPHSKLIASVGRTYPLELEPCNKASKTAPVLSRVIDGTIPLSILHRQKKRSNKQRKLMRMSRRPSFHLNATLEQYP